MSPATDLMERSDSIVPSNTGWAWRSQRSGRHQARALSRSPGWAGRKRGTRPWVGVGPKSVLALMAKPCIPRTGPKSEDLMRPVCASNDAQVWPWGRAGLINHIMDITHSSRDDIFRPAKLHSPQTLASKHTGGRLNRRTEWLCELRAKKSV
ncbi:hypothetical protein H103_08896 [Trichophyton rubrum CBS 288.86]|uniref:Uncharacterized protein n=1 Tax=Trichophyton rubrum CBS 288.86 TaxID=1215330 RepID=A0A022VLR8_TRIRU|nr:hypothetical protein H103_08896 [Trichophyton rubrum CBS 288.86]